MEGAIADQHAVRFIPAEVRGLDCVTEVAIFPDRLEVKAGARLITVAFRDIAKRQENLISFWIKRLVGRATYPMIVGEREFCTARRHVDFYTVPKLKIYTPPDSDAKYEETYIYRINSTIRKDGFCTRDMS